MIKDKNYSQAGLKKRLCFLLAIFFSLSMIAGGALSASCPAIANLSGIADVKAAGRDLPEPDDDDYDLNSSDEYGLPVANNTAKALIDNFTITLKGKSYKMADLTPAKFEADGWQLEDVYNCDSYEPDAFISELDEPDGRFVHLAYAHPDEKKQIRVILSFTDQSFFDMFRDGDIEAWDKEWQDLRPVAIALILAPGGKINAAGGLEDYYIGDDLYRLGESNEAFVKVLGKSNYIGDKALAGYADKFSYLTAGYNKGNDCDAVYFFDGSFMEGLFNLLDLYNLFGDDNDDYEDDEDDEGDDEADHKSSTQGGAGSSAIDADFDYDDYEIPDEASDFLRDFAEDPKIILAGKSYDFPLKLSDFLGDKKWEISDTNDFDADYNDDDFDGEINPDTKIKDLPFIFSITIMPKDSFLLSVVLDYDTEYLDGDLTLKDCKATKSSVQVLRSYAPDGALEKLEKDYGEFQFGKQDISLFKSLEEFTGFYGPYYKDGMMYQYNLGDGCRLSLIPFGEGKDEDYQIRYYYTGDGH